MSIETAESAVALIDAATDSAESSPVVETSPGITRPMRMERWADSVDATKKIVLDFTDCWLNPVDSPGCAALKSQPIKTWVAR